MKERTVLSDESFLRGRNSRGGKDVSYREDGLCVAELLDGEVSSGSLSCHSQSATSFCQRKRKRERERERERSEARRGEERIAGEKQRVLGTAGFPPLPWSPQGSPGPSAVRGFPVFLPAAARNQLSI